MPSKSARKGSVFEREIVNTLREAGLDAKRAYGSNGLSLGLTEDVDVLIEGTWKVQAKRYKRLSKIVRPRETVHFQIVREDLGKSFVVMPLELLIEFLKQKKEETQPGITANI